MNAKITYRIGEAPHPFDPDARKKGVCAWCVFKVVTPELGIAQEQAVALFDHDSEAKLFMAHVFTAGQDHVLVTIDRDYRGVLKTLAEQSSGR